MSENDNLEHRIICPTCHREIDSLVEIEWMLIGHRLVNINGHPYWEEVFRESVANSISDGTDIVWNCPECDAEIAYSQEKAFAFLGIGEVE